ncbi:glycosyltransferase [Microbacterium sp. NPDC089320]|uniref:glycosyltransferase n=1 Tax=Microbacterium sp. NPDC089320 TaxID=3155182 RepID=UPI00342996B1
MLTLPAISIIIPTHNDEEWIAAALESCIQQTFGSLEVICVDDASTDGTREIIERFRARDSRVRLLVQEVNGSAFEARRRGAEAASAPYLLYLDSDDELAPRTAEAAIARARESGVDVVGFGVEVVNVNGGRIPSFAKDIQPRHARLAEADILPNLFPPGKLAHGHIWGYLFRTELVRHAYGQIATGQYVPRANDLPIAFLALASAASYASIPEHLYRYFFRRGASGHPVTNTADFSFYLGAVRSIELIADAVSHLPAGSDRGNAARASYDSARLSVIGNVLAACVEVADRALQADCLAMIRDSVSDTDIVRATVRFAPKALEMLARNVDRAAQPRTHVRSVVLSTADLRTGGVQGVVVSQAQSLLDAGIAVTIATQRDEESVYDLPTGVRVVRVEGDSLAERVDAWISICREARADLVLDHHVLYNRVWPAFALAARSIGVPTIGFLHSFALRPVRDDNDLLSFLVRYLPLLDTVSTLSSTDVAFWKLRGIQHVVRLPHPPSPMLRELARTSEPKAPPVGPLKLVWWGRLQQSTKQVRSLILVAAELRRIGIDFDLTIIGPDTTDLSAARLLEDGEKLGIADVLTMPGALHGDELRRAVSQSHIYVSASLIEGSPLTLVEAQAMGLPVAMFDLPWLENLVQNDGVLVAKQGDVRDLAQQIARLATDPELYVETSSASLEAARRATDFDFAELYAMLLEGRLPASFSPEPTTADAQLLLEWTAFYAEANSAKHHRQNVERLALRDEVRALRRGSAQRENVKLREQLQSMKSKFFEQRERTAELKRQLRRRSVRRLLRVEGLKRRSTALISGTRTLVASLAENKVPQPVTPREARAIGRRPIMRAVKRANTRAMPDVSVIIPVYNSAPWLEECIQSVLKQTGVKLEVICINDGSTDDSREILGTFADRDQRVRIIDQENSGQSVGRNAGLDAAKGRYVIYLDSDDYWSQDSLAEFVRQADAERLDVLLVEGHAFRDGDIADDVWSRYERYYQRSKEYGPVRDGVGLMVEMRRTGDYRVHVGMYLARTEYVRREGVRFIPGIVHQDNPYTFELILRADRVAHRLVDFYARRLRPGSTITTLKAASSAKGYYLGYIAMSRQLASRPLAADDAATLSDLVHNVFVSGRKQFVQLPNHLGDELKQLDPSPDAQLIFRTWRSSR